MSKKRTGKKQPGTGCRILVAAYLVYTIIFTTWGFQQIYTPAAALLPTANKTVTITSIIILNIIIFIVIILICTKTRKKTIYTPHHDTTRATASKDTPCTPPSHAQRKERRWGLVWMGFGKFLFSKNRKCF